jgi:hypothetical protein
MSRFARLPLDLGYGEAVSGDSGVTYYGNAFSTNPFFLFVFRPARSAMW